MKVKCNLSSKCKVECIGKDIPRQEFSLFPDMRFSFRAKCVGKKKRRVSK
jgi:hypothetical protein